MPIVFNEILLSADTGIKKSCDTIVEKLDELGWSDKDLSIEFNNRKVQSFDDL